MNTSAKLFSILLSSILVFIFECPATYAATVAGQVQFVFGNVQVTTKAGATHALKKGDSIEEGDAVTTAFSSSAQIRMKDGGFVAIRPDTKMKFDKFVFNGRQDGEERSYFSLFKGGFRAVTGLIGKVNKLNYRITTATATIGVRGTDHETYFVPVGSALVPAGAYSKVNVGETTLTTNRGTIVVTPNQMGFSSGINDVPKIVPLNTNIFTVAAAPTKSVKERNTERAKQADISNSGDKQGGQQTAKQDTAPVNASAGDTSTKTTVSTSDPTSIRPVDTENVAMPPNNNLTTANPTTVSVQPDVPAPNVPQLIVPIILTNALTGTILDTTTQSATQGGVVTALTGSSIFSTAYAANYVVVESSYGSTYGSTYGSSNGSLIDPAYLVYVTGAAGGNSSSGALASYTEQSVAGGSNFSYVSTISGGTASSFNAPSFGLTGIQYGSWAGYTGQSFTQSSSLGGNNGGGQTNWMYAPQGYIDSTYLSGTTIIGLMSGTLTYQMDGANAPRYQSSGATGTLNSATITTNFATMTVSATLGLNIGTDFWGASLTNQTISSVVGGAFSGSAISGGTSNTLTVTHGTGSATTCPTCSGNLSGMFTGQDFAGAILSYNLSDSANGGSVFGDAALTRVTYIPPSAPAPTGMTIIECGSGCLGTYSSTGVVTSGNVLTQYSGGGTNAGSTFTNNVTVNCPTCTAIASGQVVTSGIYYGTWTSGTYSSTSTTSIAGGSTTPAYWITGPEAGPLYLPQALTGTASFALDAGQISNSSGVAGTVKGTTALSVNFTNQTVGINLDASITDATATLHTWNAQAASVPLVGNQGIGGASFHAGTGFSGNSSGVLSVTVDGTTAGTGSIDGQLTGSGLTGAIISFNLSVASVNGGYTDTLNGVAAFSGTAQNINAPYRSVLLSTYDPSALVPTLGFYFNNPSRVIQDAAGNLTQFDSNSVNSSGGNVTISNTGSTLTDQGTDPVSGISWGRWSGGTLNVTNRATGAVTSTALAGSLHWIAEPVSTSAVTLPITGTYSYTYAGGTKPTDNLGNVGTLNSASVTANFTAQTVNLGVNATVAGATLNATGTNAPIIQRTVFYASSIEPTTSSSYLTVTCTGTCSGTPGGTVIGKFTGTGAIGVAMSYGLQNGSSVVSGVAAFHR